MDYLETIWPERAGMRCGDRTYAALDFDSVLIFLHVATLWVAGYITIQRLAWSLYRWRC